MSGYDLKAHFKRRRREENVLMCAWIGVTFLFCASFLTLLTAWLTHLAWSVRLLLDPAAVAPGKFVLAALGAFMPPVGIIHGIMLWLA